MSSILNDPVMVKNSRYQKVRSSSSTCGHFFGLLSLQSPLWVRHMSCLVAHMYRHISAAMHGRVSLTSLHLRILNIDLIWVVRKSDNSIHRINRFPADSVVCFINIYPLDSDFMDSFIERPTIGACIKWSSL